MSEDFNSERLRRIEAALLELTNLDQQIFLAMRLDSMSVEEIARRTGLSQRQVVKRLGRAIRHLGKRLNELDRE
ncbi:sigma-70 region 4 domain-containing protein [Novosphingobium sp. 1949]|uniref:Sigma-70 region 4 domain-containing protein n=1 Tax=Novosphingobium organovorum TaxID=2930092 RepID=A0ABT0BJ46_9SPHN|nr:sigma-70 region 4 domain-containing protein [Novosphingobium organovorum]MCJ2185082.1 sigma-70 region 4 domain-containing protein [Novosphingobium organovorum]